MAGSRPSLKQETLVTKLRSMLVMALVLAADVTAHELSASEVRSSAVSLVDAQGPYGCGIGTAMIVPGASESDLATAVEVQVLTAITSDSPNLVGVMRIRVVRVIADAGRIHIIGAPLITEAMLSVNDGAPLASIGPGLSREDDGFFYQSIDSEAARRLIRPSQTALNRVVSFRDSIANAREFVSFRYSLARDELATYRTCLDAVLERGKVAASAVALL